MNSFVLGSSNVTTTIDFVEADFEACLNGFLSVRKNIAENISKYSINHLGGVKVKRGNNSDIETIFQEMDATKTTAPSSIAKSAPSLIVLMETQSQWTAAFGNGMYGISSVDHVEMTAQFMRKKFIRVVVNESKDNASVQLVYKDFSQEKTQERVIYVHKEGGWRFLQYGTPFPFEKTQNYNVARKRDRFTVSLLREYLNELGISLDSDFFGGNYAIVNGHLHQMV
jgi:hypothetical protein